MVPWAFGVPLVLVSALGLFLNGYVLLVVLGLGKQVNKKKKKNATDLSICIDLLELEYEK